MLEHSQSEVLSVIFSEVVMPNSPESITAKPSVAVAKATTDESSQLLKTART